MLGLCLVIGEFCALLYFGLNIFHLIKNFRYRRQLHMCKRISCGIWMNFIGERYRLFLLRIRYYQAIVCCKCRKGVIYYFSKIGEIPELSTTAETRQELLSHVPFSINNSFTVLDSGVWYSRMFLWGYILSLRFVFPISVGKAWYAPWKGSKVISKYL